VRHRSEKWKTTDDRGLDRFVVVDYDDRDCAMVTREILHDLLMRAGMRLTFDATEEPT